ncbi:hypothetical protein DPMN_040906 [Dreissena polymorpha]|uniref:BTB domain-containing protein n=1 Tax=Dreissena polymorpha TaxID=45954 RepID=A0A9D4HVH3_DREPO|nr:hypothetical protein DPMN_040906 [Dreissena polymorpha]
MSEESQQNVAKSVAENNPFEQPGEYGDEITITFEHNEKLYVSKVFLRHISSVFKTMFKCHCVEVNSFSLEITDFNKDDFLEFLLCCYTGTLKRLNSTFLNIYILTEIIKECGLHGNAWNN